MKKMMMKALIVLGALTAGAMGVVAVTNVNHETDRKALLAIKDAYEQALNNDNLAGFTPHFDPAFNGVLATGAEISSTKEFEQHWAQIKGLVGIGKGGKYSVKVVPVPMGTMFVSDVAVSFGTTDDSLTLAREPGKKYDFHTSWVAVSRNQGGTWKVASLHTSMLHPENTFNKAQLETVAKLVAELKAKNAAKPEAEKGK